MEESLFLRAKLEAARQGRTVSALLEDALRRYFEPPADQVSPPKSVAETWGSMTVSDELLREVMEDEDDWLDD